MLRLILVSLILLSGCTTQPVVSYNTRVVSPDDNLLMNCTFTAPPDIKTYMETPFNKREKVLGDYIGTLLNDGNVCNQKLRISTTKGFLKISGL